MAKSTKKKPESQFVVVSYVDGDRRTHKVRATSYRDAKTKVAKQLREDLDMWDTNLADIKGQGMMIAKRVPDALFGPVSS